MIDTLTHPQKSTAGTKEVVEIIINIRTSLPEIDRLYLNDARKDSTNSTTLAIKYTFIIQGIMNIVIDKTTDPGIAEYLQSKQVWDEASHTESFGAYLTLKAHLEAFEERLRLKPVTISISKAKPTPARVTNHRDHSYAPNVAVASVYRSFVGQFRNTIWGS
ncbi:hypothetical protein DL96DRAFT_1771012 [Flagelloscypha sp. PMI_526]|nr:hypothetical protein DL96DRAFT_1771012 [Flagelloscypha sp. PMI_526]